jgi:ferredoxin-type protein NapF
MDTSRRRFLRGQPAADIRIPRLPWALDDSSFTAGCTRCGDCLRACPEQIIVHGDGGFPQVDFSRNACTFCHACVDACKQPIFHHDAKPWHAVAVIDQRCLTQQQVYCQNCKDACGERAIRFQFGRNGMSHPQILLDACTGCGACVAPCPTQAIRIQTDTPGTPT